MVNRLSLIFSLPMITDLSQLCLETLNVYLCVGFKRESYAVTGSHPKRAKISDFFRRIPKKK